MELGPNQKLWIEALKSGDFSFDEIADFMETNPESVFKESK